MPLRNWCPCELGETRDDAWEYPCHYAQECLRHCAQPYQAGWVCATVCCSVPPRPRSRCHCRLRIPEITRAGGLPRWMQESSLRAGKPALRVATVQLQRSLRDWLLLPLLLLLLLLLRVCPRHPRPAPVLGKARLGRRSALLWLWAPDPHESRRRSSSSQRVCPSSPAAVVLPDGAASRVTLGDAATEGRLSRVPPCVECASTSVLSCV